MPKTTERTRDQRTLEFLSKLVADSQPKGKWQVGPYRMEELAQDQVVIEINRGFRCDRYKALRILSRDAQSDADCELSSGLFVSNWGDLELPALGGLDVSAWNAFESWGKLFPTDSDSQPCEQEAVDDLSIIEQIGEAWTSDRLADELLALDTEDGWPRLREVIVTAEDYQFTPEQSVKLRPRLLGLAIEHRESNDPQDRLAVFSAIRTGASMLRPNEADRLLPLLRPGHSIDTSLVTLKMIGRIFEAQPPEELGQYPDLAGEVRVIADALLNPYSIASSQSAAMAQLAVYALAAMADSGTLDIVEDVQRMGVSWFTEQTAHELRELRSYWDGRTDPVAPEVLQLLEDATQVLQKT